MSVATLSSESTKTPQVAVKAELYCREAAKQMVEVVKVSGSPEDLTCLVRGLLFGFGEGEKDKKVAERKRRQEDARKQCKSLTSSLFEILLQFEETRSNQETDGKELAAIFSTLGVFSQSYPELLVPHVDTIMPYLKGDNGAKRYEAQIVTNVSNIISRIASHFSLEELSRLTTGGLPTDLVNVAYKFPSDAVNAAIEALCKLANHHHAKPDSVQEKKLHKLAVQVRSSRA
jgi:pyruvate-formate lyase-activating enzyme